MSYAIELLQSEVANLSEGLSSLPIGERAERIGRINECDAAIALLLKCGRHGIVAADPFIVLPTQRIRSGSSDLRVLEDLETEDRAVWKEVVVQGKPLRLSEGNVVVSCSQPRDDSRSSR
jgi:hypothetical protein